MYLQIMEKHGTWLILKKDLNKKLIKLGLGHFGILLFQKHLIHLPKIICKATDASFNTQPEPNKLSWNLRGLNNNTWHTTS